MPSGAIDNSSCTFRTDARWAAPRAFSSDPVSWVVRTVFLGRKKRACFRRAIPQIGNRQLPAEDSVLGVATTSGVEGVAVLRVAEPLRRAALAALELTLAPEADRVHCSRSDQAGIAVHNVLPQPARVPLSAPRQCGPERKHSTRIRIAGH